MLEITVVIPTYNRRELLTVLVDSLRQQTFSADRYEILIVSDGSTDGTDELYSTPLSSPATRLVRQEKRGFGLSAARNLGLRKARGRLVMFLDDDMVAHQSLVEMHVEAHRGFDQDVAVCGHVRLAPDMPDTPFCQIVLAEVSRLFDQDAQEAHFLPFYYALSWQTSFRRAVLERLGGYDETFRCYGWEDIEFSYRATQGGMRFYYEPRAISFHRDQRDTLAKHADRVRNAARMVPVLFARHPDLKSLLPMYADKGPIDWQTDCLGLIIRKAIRRLSATQAVIRVLESITPVVERLVSRRAVLRRWYYIILGSYMQVGYREGLAQMSASTDAP